MTSRHVNEHPTSASLPKLEKGNEWRFDEDIRQWEIVMTREHPQWTDHLPPDMPDPTIWHAVSSTYHPLPAKVKMTKTTKLVSSGLTVTVELDDESRKVFGAVEHWDVVLLPRQGEPSV